MTNLTIHELMAEDMIIECKKLNSDHVKISISDENEKLVYEENTHVFAWEALVDFAKQVVAEDKRLNYGVEE